MPRFLAGVAACFLFMTGAFLLWQGRGQQPEIAPAPQPRFAAVPAPTTLSPIPQAPTADPNSN